MKLPARLRAASADPEDNLSWIDDFWSRAGAHIFAREEDGVLILPPNMVYRANGTAAALVAYLRKGGRMADIQFPSPEARRDTSLFFGDLAALYRGDGPANGTVSAVPYDFSFTKLPVLGELAVTYRCNNACRFCYAGCGGDAEAALRRPELGTEEYKAIIDIFADRARIPFFSFTGGEPTLRDDLEILVAHAASRGLSTNLVTNGTLIDSRRAEALRRCGLGSVQVSLEADSEILHDELTGRRGAYKECLAGIAALLGANIPTQTNTTLTRLNVERAPLLPSFFKSLGIARFAMNLFIPTFPGAQADALFVSYEEIAPVVEAVAKEAKRRALVFYWYSPTPFCTFNPISKGMGNKSCAAADGLLSVAPDGSVLPCSSWDEPLGNLRRDDFSALWFSEGAALHKQKRFAPESCRSCESFVPCQGACPLYWRFTHSTPRPRSCP